MGIEPTTSGLDLPLLCRLSYKVAQRKSGTILDGESRRIESKGTYVVPRSTGNTNSGFDSHRGQKNFSLPRKMVPCFPLLGLTPSGLIMGLCST